MTMQQLEAAFLELPAINHCFTVMFCARRYPSAFRSSPGSECFTTIMGRFHTHKGAVRS
jgi:hypothetical protein